MNKLISRNSIQRFKEGRKIIKAQDGTYLGQPVYKRDFLGNSYYLKNERGNIVPGINILRSQLDNKKIYSTGNAKGIVYQGADGKLYQNGKEVYKRTTPSKSQQITTKPNSKKNIANTVKDNSTQNKLSNEGSTGGSTGNKSVNSNKGIAGGNTSFKTAFNNARNSGLQEFTWNGKRFNTKKAGEENYIWQNGNWVNPNQNNALTFKPIDNLSLELPKVTANNLAGLSGNTSVIQPTKVEPVIQPRNYFNYTLPNYDLIAQNRLKQSGIRTYLKQGGNLKFKFSNKG